MSLIKNFNIILDRVIHHRMVTVQKTHKLLNGVNESLAALRGWMLLGEEKFKKDEKVFVVAHPLGVDSNGSFSEYITVPDLWVEKLSKDLTSKEIMMIGTSGFTATKALNKTLKTIFPGLWPQHRLRALLFSEPTANTLRDLRKIVLRLRL